MLSSPGSKDPILEKVVGGLLSPLLSSVMGGLLSSPSLLGLLSSPYLLGLLSSPSLLGLLSPYSPSLLLSTLLGFLSTSLSEMLLVVSVVLISTDSGVILPKMSTSNEILDLMILMVPFLMAMTFPTWIKAVASPLKKALAAPV